MKRPLYTIILPTCRRIEKFRNALNSILRQENSDWELIVINDGEKDVKKYLPIHENIFYIQNKKKVGAATSRNIGIQLSKGDFIAYLDDDDEWLPHHLSIDSNILLNFDFIYSGSEVRKGERLFPWYNENFSYKKLAERNIITTPSVVHKRTLLTKAGYWNENLPCLQDWEMWCRMLLKTEKVFHRDDVTVIINLSDNSITSKSANTKVRKKTIAYIKCRYYVPLLIKNLRKRIKR